MVYTKNAFSTEFDLSSIGAKTKPKTNTNKKDGEDSFKTVLDKNAQKKDAETKDAVEKKDEIPSNDNTQIPKKEEDLECTDGAEMQPLVQYFAPEQEKAALNWAEMLPGAAEGEAVEGKAANLVQAVDMSEQTMLQANTKTDSAAVETQITSDMQNALQNSGKTEAVQQNTTPMAAVLEQKPDSQEQVVEVAKGTEEQIVMTAKEEGSAKNVENDVPQAEREQKETPELQNTMFKKAFEEEPLVRIKVGETIDISAPKAVSQLADTVLVKMQEGSNEYELQLQPEELGKIKIKLVIEAGRISVAMSCENQKAADLLAANGGRLKAIIEERTGSETNVQVQQEDKPAYYQQERQNQDGRSQEQSQQDQRQNNKKQADVVDFLQQLRLGLLEIE